MSKYVMVDALSMFNMKYCLELPDGIEDKDVMSYVEEMVTSGNVKEFSQTYGGETVKDYEFVTKTEIVDTFRSAQPYFASWDEEHIMRSVTPVGFDADKYYEEEDKKWKMNLN